MLVGISKTMKASKCAGDFFAFTVPTASLKLSITSPVLNITKVNVAIFLKIQGAVHLPRH